MTCLRPSCERPAHTRGLCKSDYKTAGNLVRRGDATWEQLEAAGVVRPATAGRHRGGGRKRGTGDVTAWMYTALRARRAA